MMFKKMIALTLAVLAMSTGLSAHAPWSNPQAALAAAYAGGGLHNSLLIYSLDARAAINLNPQTLDELRRVIWARQYPQNVQQAFAIAVDGMANDDLELRKEAAELFLRLLEKFPQEQYKNCKKFFRKGIRKALSLSSNNYGLGRLLNGIFAHALANNKLEFHKILLATCLDAFEDAPNVVMKSVYFLEALTTCLESCGRYTNGSVGERKFHARVTSRVFGILQMFFEHHADECAARRLLGILQLTMDAMIELLCQATQLDNPSLQQLIYDLGATVYNKQRAPGYYRPHDDQFKASEETSHAARMVKLGNALAALEHNLA